MAEIREWAETGAEGGKAAMVNAAKAMFAAGALSSEVQEATGLHSAAIFRIKQALKAAGIAMASRRRVRVATKF